VARDQGDSEPSRHRLPEWYKQEQLDDMRARFELAAPLPRSRKGRNIRGFVYGAVTATAVWAFVSLGGAAKISQAYTAYTEQRRLEATDALAREREQRFLANYRPQPDCMQPRTELKKLECRNREDMARRSFYAHWNNANAQRFPK
jgi:hypothetical protein